MKIVFLNKRGITRGIRCSSYSSTPAHDLTVFTDVYALAPHRSKFDPTPATKREWGRILILGVRHKQGILVNHGRGWIDLKMVVGRET
jgi:hypothetical protein